MFLQVTSQEELRNKNKELKLKISNLKEENRKNEEEMKLEISNSKEENRKNEEEMKAEISNLKEQNHKNEKEWKNESDKLKFEINELRAKNHCVCKKVFDDKECPYTYTIQNVSAMLKDKNYTGYLYSDPFIFLDGYVGMLCVSLNGHKEESRNHISVFFYIHKGPFDDLLEWPMLFGIITFQLFVNEICARKMSINCKEESEKLKDIFNKPTTEGRKAVVRGWSRFIAHNELPDNIEDDELKFYVDVEKI